jgi:membrane dipeptidase
VAQRVGIDHVGIGLDYAFGQDGMKNMRTEHSNLWPAGYGYHPGIKFVPPEALPDVTEEVLRRAYSEHEIRCVLGENLLRVARQVWKWPRRAG